MLVGVGEGDTEADCEYANKITGLRIFDDGEVKMNFPLDLMDKNIEVECLISHLHCMETVERQKTVVARAEEPQRANYLHEYFVNLCKDKGIHVRQASSRQTCRLKYTMTDPSHCLWTARKNSRR